MGRETTRKEAEPARGELWDLLDEFPQAAAGLRDAVRDGRIDGARWNPTGAEATCIYGWVGRLAGLGFAEVEALLRRERLRRRLHPLRSTPVESMVTSIASGDTPALRPAARKFAAWIDEWMQAK